MSYGIEIINTNDRILIDENYPHLEFITTTPDSYTMTNTTSAFTGNANQQAGDLILGRAATNTNGWIGGQGLVGGQWGRDGPYGPPPASTVLFHLVRNMASVRTASTSGYGLEVYGSNGTDVYFSSNISKGLDIVEVGSFNSVSAGAEYFRYPASGNLSNFDKHYCVLNNGMYDEILTSGFPNIAYTTYIVGYQYNWVTSTTGYFNIGSWYQTYYTQTFQTVITRINVPFHYMILKEVG